MFELNLIRERTEARARKRRLALVVSLVLLVSFAMSGGIFYLYLGLKQETDEVLNARNEFEKQRDKIMSDLGKWTQVKTIRNTEIERYYALDPIFNYRPLFGPIIRDLTRFSEVVDPTSENLTQRWFTDIAFKRGNEEMERYSPNLETVLKPLYVSGKFVVYRKGTELLGMIEEEKENFKRLWNDSPDSLVKTFTGPVPVDGIKVFEGQARPVDGGAAPDPNQPLVERTWKIPLAFTYSKGVEIKVTKPIEKVSAPAMNTGTAQ